MIPRAGIADTFRRAVRTARIVRAGRKLRRAKTDHKRMLAKQALTAILSDARGIAMKVGQIFADRSGDEILQPLVAGIPPRPFAEMVPVIEAELGRPVDAVFASIDEAGAAASLGQVHRATLHDGTEVAVKVRYPGIAVAVAAELRLAGLMPKAGPVRRWGFDLEGYKRALQENMVRELDYRSEADRQQRFSAAVRVSGLRVPEIHAEYCSEKLLVQTFERGDSIESVADWPLRDRLLVGRTLVTTMFKSLFAAGEVHGDPHPGNLLFRVDGGVPQVVLLDYGCTVPVSEQQRLALLKLIVGLREGEKVSALQCFSAMGFDAAKLGHIESELSVLAGALFKPFLISGSFDPAAWGLGAAFESTLGENRWWFRSSGPPELLLLLRAFQGLAGQLERLSIRLPWWPLLVTAVGDELLAQARAIELPELPETSRPGHAPRRGTASALRVELKSGGETKASFSFPPAAALDLESLIPESMVRKLNNEAIIRLAEAGSQVRREGLVPQELALLSLSDQQIRVWLE